MTTAAKAKATKAPQHDLTHGPVAAAVNASAWPMFVAAIGKWTGIIPPWTVLIATIALAVCMVLAGRHRHPRPLSRVSLVYRAVAVLTAGGWLFTQLATFQPTTINSGQVTALMVTWPATVAGLVLAVAASRIPPLLRLMLPGVPFLIAVMVTVTCLSQVTAWLHDALTVVDRFPQGHADAVVWLGTAILTLIIGAAPMTVLGVTFASRERTADEELAALNRDNLPRTVGEEGRKMLKLLCKISNEYTEWRPSDATQPGRRVPNLSIIDVRFWDNGAGETYVIDLRRTERGTTRVQLRGHSDLLAQKMNLPHGCGVEVLPAKDHNGEPLGQGFAALEVCRVNILKLEIPYPPLQPRSILNPLPLGRTRSDIEIGPLLREGSMYLWGQKGSGKTGTIYDLIAGALQCTDCLVWVIDRNKGNAAKPFLRAFAEGRVDRPCIDWVATTLDEVVEMAQVALEIALDRKAYYADLKFERDLNLMPVGNGGPGEPPPEILIVIDEGATVLGLGGAQMTDEARAARDALEQIMDLARDAAVNIVFSGLRATADVAGTAFMRGTSVRVGMRVTDDAELAHGFGDWKLSAKQIPYPGSGYIRCGHSNPDEGDDIQVFKAYYLAPKRMAGIGEEVTKWRPYLDERSLRTAGIRYANRWRRTARYLWENPRPEVVNYGARPGTSDPGVIDGEVVTTPAGTTTAVADPPHVSTGTDKIAAAGLSMPTGGTWDDLMKQANKAEEARRRLEQQGAGSSPSGGGGEAPAPARPDGGAQTPADPATPRGDDYYAKRFEDLATHMQVLPEDPHRHPWSRSGRITPDQELAAAPAATRDILERLVRVHGPITAKVLHEMLITGGDWGPAVKISQVAMYKALKSPDQQGPAEWLAPRAKGEPYDHRDNQSG